ncbi:hypothetical protein KXD40_003149 [Peronospora effusa]|uniref:Uncharacterized protein n=1 Tax=Peronospora effusa TaxID=542832 RepID=A0A3R7Y514_9STRA|nr:hypothetical protein DD237_006399 [Peronospora effusa]UIZ29817.1 hypothetical protein KXD40_003149 [Peronospora effusa]
MHVLAHVLADKIVQLDEINTVLVYEALAKDHAHHVVLTVETPNERHHEIGSVFLCFPLL